MPISKQNKARYPKNWSSEIRPKILSRAGHCCEFCGVKNYAQGVRYKDGEFKECTFEEAEEAMWYEFDCRPIRIILTIAHIFDMNPENCIDWNLAALCQRCHNRHDAEFRRQNRKKNAKNNPGSQAVLFQDP